MKRLEIEEISEYSPMFYRNNGYGRFFPVARTEGVLFYPTNDIGRGWVVRMKVGMHRILSRTLGSVFGDGRYQVVGPVVESKPIVDQANKAMVLDKPVSIIRGKQKQVWVAAIWGYI